MNVLPTKVKKMGQRVICCGFHRHVGGRDKTLANKKVRQILRKQDEQDQTS